MISWLENPQTSSFDVCCKDKKLDEASDEVDDNYSPGEIQSELFVGKRACYEFAQFQLKVPVIFTHLSMALPPASICGIVSRTLLLRSSPTKR
jgi:hypothetical protein